MIESAIALPIAVIGITGFFVLIWSLCIALIAHHTLYEMLICSESYPIPANCGDIAKTNIEQLLIWGHLDKIDFEKSSSSAKAVAKISLPLNLKLQLQESLHLPLEAP